MLSVKTTLRFREWLSSLKDPEARNRILTRLTALEAGNFGDIKPCGGGLSEIRIHSGPGYRLYVAQRGAELVTILVGGSKRTQKRDMAAARAMMKEL